MRHLARLGIRSLRLLLLPFDALDRAFAWLGKRPLELLAGLYLVGVGAAGVLLILFYFGRRDSLTGWLLGSLLLAASLGGIYLLTPKGTARFGPELVQMWFRGMAAVAAAVALAFLSAAASVTDPAQANADMTMVSLAAVLAFLSVLVSLRSLK